MGIIGPSCPTVYLQLLALHCQGHVGCLCGPGYDLNCPLLLFPASHIMLLVRGCERARRSAGVSAVSPHSVPLVQQHVATPVGSLHKMHPARSNVGQSPLGDTLPGACGSPVHHVVQFSPCSLVRHLYLQRQATSLSAPDEGCTGLSGLSSNFSPQTSSHDSSLVVDQTHCPRIQLGKRMFRGGYRRSKTANHRLWV